MAENLAERRVVRRPILQNTDRNLDRHRDSRFSRKPRSATRPSRPAGGLMATVKHIRDVVDLLRPCHGVARSGPPIDVAEPGGHGVHRNAGLKTGWPSTLLASGVGPVTQSTTFHGESSNPELYPMGGDHPREG
jgi:hypothetical protein